MNRPELAWQEHCAAISDLIEQGETDAALNFLVGEKFTTYLRVARTDKRFKDQLGPFAEHIKSLFKPWELEAWFQKQFTPPEKEPDPVHAEADAELEVDIAENQLRDMYLLEDAEKWLIKR